jgi:tetratricopeptide (TPR) repeat protein
VVDTTQLKSANEQRGTLIGRLRKRERSLRETNEQLRAATERLTVAHRQAVQARKRAEEQERDAQESFLRAQQAIENLLTLAQHRLRNEPGIEKIRKALREEAVQMCLHFTRKTGTTPSARLRAARAHRMVGHLEERWGQAREALGDYAESLKLYEALIAEIPREQWGPIDFESEALQAAMSRWAVLESTHADEAERELKRIFERLDRPSTAGAKNPRSKGKCKN